MRFEWRLMKRWMLKKKGEERVILFNLSGHGHFDLASYETYMKGELVNYAYPEEKIHAALQNLPQIQTL